MVQGRRADAFRLLIAPQLRGEGNWPKPALYSPAEARIFFSCDAALTSLPFWRKVCSLLSSIRPPCHGLMCRLLHQALGILVRRSVFLLHARPLSTM